MIDSFYAHTGPGAWEPLDDHLTAVADRAGLFAGRFGVKAWGRTAGSLHDLGKYTPESNAYYGVRFAAPNTQSTARQLSREFYGAGGDLLGLCDCWPPCRTAGR